MLSAGPSTRRSRSSSYLSLGKHYILKFRFGQASESSLTFFNGPGSQTVLHFVVIFFIFFIFFCVLFCFV